MDNSSAVVQRGGKDVVDVEIYCRPLCEKASVEKLREIISITDEWEEDSINLQAIRGYFIHGLELKLAAEQAAASAAV